MAGKNGWSPSPWSKRHNQLWHKRWTGYRKFKLLELYVWAKYFQQQAWLDAAHLPDYTSYLPDDTSDLIYDGY